MRGLRTGLGFTKRVPLSGAALQAALDAIIAKLIIPTLDGPLTSLSSATVDPDTGASIAANFASGRTVRIGTKYYPEAALLVQGASTGLMGAMTASAALTSNSTAAGDYPIQRTLIEDTTNSVHTASSGLVALTDGVNYVASCYFRPFGSSARNIALYVADSTDTNHAFITVDRSTLAIGQNIAGTASIVRSSARFLANGWIFLQMTFASTAWGGTCRSRSYIVQGVATSFTGDGVSGIQISGYDVIQGEYARTPLAWDGSLGVSRIANTLTWNRGLGTVQGFMYTKSMPWGRSGLDGAAVNILFSAAANSDDLLYNASSSGVFQARRTDAIANVRTVFTAAVLAVAGGQQAITQRWDAASNRTTLNGVTSSSGVPTLPFAVATPITIGNRAAADRPFDGHVFTALSTSVLTDQELSLLDANTEILTTTAAMDQLSRLLAEASIPTVNGILASTSTATVDPDTGATVPVNTANGRSVRVGNVTLPGAALLAQGASTGVFGALTVNGNLASNTTAAGNYPTERTIVENTVAGFHNATSATVTLTDGVNYTYSAMVKRGVGVRNAGISCGFGSNSAGINIDLDTFTITNSVAGNGVVVRSSYRVLANGFVFLQFTFNSPAWGVAVRIALAPLFGASANYTGDGVSSIITSGYDVIQADFARTPLAWDGSLGVSRVANLLQWNQALDTTAGTIIARVMPWGRSGTVGSANLRVYDAAANGRIYYNPADQKMSAERIDAILSNRYVDTGTGVPAIAGAQQAITQRWDATANRITVGAINTASGTPTLPWAVATPVIIGNNAVLSAAFDGHCFVAKWPRALSDAEVNAWIANTNILVP